MESTPPPPPSSTEGKNKTKKTHNASDMLLIPLELIKSNRDNVNQAREINLNDRGQTLEPQGLNRGGET